MSTPESAPSAQRQRPPSLSLSTHDLLYPPPHARTTTPITTSGVLSQAQSESTLGVHAISATSGSSIRSPRTGAPTPRSSSVVTLLQNGNGGEPKRESKPQLERTGSGSSRGGRGRRHTIEGSEGPIDARRDARPTGITFGMIFFSLCVSSFLSAMDLTAVSTALPTILRDLRGGGRGNFVWIGSAFALAGTAILPWTGGLSRIFGRKMVLLTSLVLFSGGSTICGASTSMAMMITGRAIQGLGDGGIISLAEIIVADLVPLSERGKWEGVLGATWAVASVVGPPLGGVLTQYVSWRWVFYMNVPIAALAFLLVSVFMRVRKHPTTFMEKMREMDWRGNALVIGATIAVTIATTWGGVRFPWDSPAIIIPLVLGFAGLALFLWYELKVAEFPTIPVEVVGNRTTVLTYFAVFFHGVIIMAVIYVLPTYFQASFGASASESGLKTLPLAFTVAPFAVIAAVSIEVTGVYKPQNWIGWGLTVSGLLCFSALNIDRYPIRWMVAQLPLGAGLGCIFTAPQFPALAPLHPRFAAQALALFTFVSSFGQTFGIVIGDSILQNVLVHKLPPSFVSIFLDHHGGSSFATSVIPQIAALPEPLRTQVRKAFGEACRVVWWCMLPLSMAGLLTNLWVVALPLHEEVDDEPMWEE